MIKKILQLLNREVPTDVLIKRGMVVGNNFNRQQGCYIDPTHCYLIEIGNDVTFSIRVVLLSHDASMKKTNGYTKLGRIKIGNHCFIGANTTILPGVEIGDNSIIGAGSVVVNCVPEGMVAAGCPAKVLGTVAEFKNKHDVAISNSTKVFGANYRMGNGLNDEKITEIKKITEQGFAYID